MMEEVHNSSEIEDLDFYEGYSEQYETELLQEEEND